MTTSQLQRILKDNRQKYTGYSKEEMINLILDQFPSAVGPPYGLSTSVVEPIVEKVVVPSVVGKRASGALTDSSSRIIKKTKKMITCGAISDSIYDSQSVDQLHDAIIDILSNFTN